MRGAPVAGRYVIEREVGRGGSATVFLAHDDREGSRVALKVLHEEFSGSRAAERFSQEIRFLRSFEHPNILTVLDSGEWNGRPFYVMRYVEGESLQERLRRERRLPFDEVVRIGRRLCDALAYAHERKVVHRDVKPANVMLAGDEVYLTDFGIAKALAPGEGQLHSTTGVARGTRAYMSPEQAMADRDLDHRSDIFSLGCVLYEMLAGQNPFHSADETRMLMRRVTDAPDPLSRHRDGVPGGLQRVVMKALAKEPADRWGSVGEMERGLGEGARPRPSMRPWVMPAAAVLVVSVLWQVPRALRQDGSRAVREQDPIDWYTANMAIAPVVEPDADVTARNDSRALVGVLRAELATVQGAPLVDLPLATGHSEFTHAQAVAAARAHHVRLLVLVSLRNVADSSYAAIALRDARADSVIRTERIEFKKNELHSDRVGEHLRAAALRRLASPTLEDDPGAGTDYRAMRALQSALMHIEAWHVDSAREDLRRALAIEPRSARVHRLLALLAFWSEEPGGVIREHAARASGTERTSDSATTLELNALDAIGRDDFSVACAGFQRLTELRPSRFEAWFGLAECLRRDPVVIRVRHRRDARRFRSDWQQAEFAYRRALPLAQRGLMDLTYERMLSTMAVTGGIARGGMSEETPRERYAAFPALDNGAIVFIPRRLSEMARASTGSVPSSLFAALERERSKQSEITLSWMKAAPSSPKALARHALALEATGDLLREPTEESEAIALLQRANAIAVDQLLRLENANALVRLEVKQQHQGHAERLADSLLEANSGATGAAAALLAPLAALRGRTGTTVRLLVKADEGPRASTDWPGVNSDPLLRELIAEVVVRTALGECSDSVRTSWERLEAAALATADSLTARQRLVDLLERSRLLYTPCDRGQRLQRATQSHSPLRAMLLAAVRGDSSDVVKQWEVIDRRRAGASAAEISWDAVFLESWALAAAGRSATAVSHLNRSFLALARSSPYLTQDVSIMGAFLRARQLRTDLQQTAARSTRRSVHQ